MSVRVCESAVCVCVYVYVCACVCVHAHVHVPGEMGGVVSVPTPSTRLFHINIVFNDSYYFCFIKYPVFTSTFISDFPRCS